MNINANSDFKNLINKKLVDERAIKNGSAEILIWKNFYLKRKTSALKTKLKIGKW